MYYTVYKITNILNGKIYIGCHKTKDLNDNYMGSGNLIKHAIQKYGIDSFQKEYIAIFDNARDMFDMEATLVNESFVSSDDTYNLKCGGNGGRDHIVNNPLYEDMQKNNGKTLSGKLKDDSALRTKWLSSLKKAALQRDKASYKPPPPTTGMTHSDSTKAKISEKNRIHQQGSGNSQYGTRWVNDGIKSFKIKNKQPLESGWAFGKIKTHHKECKCGAIIKPRRKYCDCCYEIYNKERLSSMDTRSRLIVSDDDAILALKMFKGDIEKAMVFCGYKPRTFGNSRNRFKRLLKSL